MRFALLDRDTLQFLAVAWALIVIGAFALLCDYPSLPEYVVVYRPPWADAPTLSPKSVFSVGRVVVMGVAQVGAATTMVFATRATGAWLRFWRWLGLVAGVKTLLECLGLLVPQGSLAERVLTLSTFAAVGMFLLSALWWWRRGDLRAHPRLESGAHLWLLAWFMLWAAFALTPLLSGG